MSKHARHQLSDLGDYSVLLERVRETFFLGKQKAEELKVQTYWEAGKLIHEHLREHEGEAGYGNQLIVRLSGSLGIGRHLLYRMVRFYEAYPIVASWQQLSWSHLRTLARVPDKKQRRQLETCAARGKWNAEKLEKEVRMIAENSPNQEPPPRRVQLLEPKRGRSGIYRIVSDGDGCSVDLGFTAYQALSAIRDPSEGANTSLLNLQSSLRGAVKPGDFVALTDTGQPTRVADATAADLYTYRAEILRVLDGDTLRLKIWLKQGYWLREKVRLRGLDCPEVATPEGKAAKRFVERLVQEAASVTITTTKPDKWDRYLSDIFIRRPDGEELFLNNVLLENGHARRYDKVTPADWEN